MSTTKDPAKLSPESSSASPPVNGHRQAGVAAASPQGRPRKLGKKIAKAGFWAFGMRICLRALAVIRTFILARLLVPADFGLYGIVLLLNQLLEVFTEIGIRSALVQRKGDIRPFLDTAWTMQVMRAVVMAGLIVIAAPFAASFFDAPDATNLIRFMALAVLLRGFVNVAALVHILRELQFHKRFGLSILDITTQVGVSIGMAVVYRSVWAFAFGALAGAIVWVIGSYVIHPYRPRLRFDRAKAGAMFSFGKWILLSHTLMWVNLRSSAVVTGKVLGSTSLGVYQLASQFTDVASREIPAIINSVMFPAFSKVQDDIPRLRRAYMGALEVGATMAFPSSVAVALLAEPLMRVILGEQWVGGAVLLPPLAVAGSLRSIQTLGGTVFKATGKPSITFRMGLIRAVVVLSLAVPLLYWLGIAGAGYAVMAGVMSTLVPLFIIVGSILKISPFRFLPPMIPGLILTGIVVVVIVLARVAFGQLGAAELAATVMLALVGYGAGSLALWTGFKVGPLKALAALRS